MRVVYIVEGGGGYKEWLEVKGEVEEELCLNWRVGRKSEEGTVFTREGKGRCTADDDRDKRDEKGRNERARHGAVQRAGKWKGKHAVLSEGMREAV
jgi:hypothetical protein